jgi:hypothetical protein
MREEKRERAKERAEDGRGRSRGPRGARPPAADFRKAADSPKPTDFRAASCEEMSRLYAAREMSPAEVSAFESHLSGCEACKKSVGEWKEFFSLLSSPAYSSALAEPSPSFDKPIMAFVKSLVRERQAVAAWQAARQSAMLRQPAAVLSERVSAATRRADLVRRRAIWVGVAAVAAVLVLFSDMLSNFAPPSQDLGRPYVVAITWVVGIFHKGFDWLVFSFVRGIKIGEIFVLVFEKLRFVWNGLGVAARQLDPQLILMEVLLLMLSLVLLKGFLGTAPKGRCTNVGIIL